jgi:ABC-type Zn uptake system ZnuABC Zn-binding protein ZnuA
MMQNHQNRRRARLSMTSSVMFAIVMLAAVVLPPPVSAASRDVGPIPDRRQSTAGRIAVSTPIFADIVANVTGDRFDVFSVMPESADPHTFEPSPQDVVAVTRSRTFIYMGANLESFIETGAWRRAVRDAGIPELRLADRLSLVKTDQVIDHGDHVHDLRGGDPHVWLDPRMVTAMVDAIAGHLSEIDPDGTDTYLANAAGYRTILVDLDREIEAGLTPIPPERRKLVVFHDAYRYFASRYGFEVIGYVLRNPGHEPSAQELAELHRTIEQAGVRVVFREPQFSAAVIERVAEDRGIIVAELLTDSFAGRVDSYVGLMRFNLASLVTHLAPTAAAPRREKLGDQAMASFTR